MLCRAELTSGPGVRLLVAYVEELVTRLDADRMLERTNQLLKEADQVAVGAMEHLRILRQRVKANRPLMEKAQRQFGLRHLLWEDLKP
jgi:hypothetical protein